MLIKINHCIDIKCPGMSGGAVAAGLAGGVALGVGAGLLGGAALGALGTVAVMDVYSR
jgi:hypothetical protein